MRIAILHFALIILFCQLDLFAQEKITDLDLNNLIAFDGSIKLADISKDVINNNIDITKNILGVAYIDPNGDRPVVWMGKEAGIKIKIGKKITAVGFFCYVGVNALKRANPGFSAITLKAYIENVEIGKLVVSKTYDDEWIIPISKIKKYIKDGTVNIVITADYSFNPKSIKIGKEDKECSYELKEIILK